MTDATATAIPASPARPKSSLLEQDALMKRRNAAESRFKYMGVAAISVSLIMLATMLWTIFSDGVSAFRQASLVLSITLNAEQLDPDGDRSEASLRKVTTLGYGNILSAALNDYIAERNISVEV